MVSCLEFHLAVGSGYKLHFGLSLYSLGWEISRNSPCRVCLWGSHKKFDTRVEPSKIVVMKKHDFFAARGMNFVFLWGESHRAFMKRTKNCVHKEGE